MISSKQKSKVYSDTSIPITLSISNNLNEDKRGKLLLAILNAGYKVKFVPNEMFKIAIEKSNEFYHTERALSSMTNCRVLMLFPF